MAHRLQVQGPGVLRAHAAGPCRTPENYRPNAVLLQCFAFLSGVAEVASFTPNRVRLIDQYAASIDINQQAVPFNETMPALQASVVRTSDDRADVP